MGSTYNTQHWKRKFSFTSVLAPHTSLVWGEHTRELRRNAPHAVVADTYASHFQGSSWRRPSPSSPSQHITFFYPPTFRATTYIQAEYALAWLFASPSKLPSLSFGAWAGLAELPCRGSSLLWPSPSLSPDSIGDWLQQHKRGWARAFNQRQTKRELGNAMGSAEEAPPIPPYIREKERTTRGLYIRPRRL